MITLFQSIYSFKSNNPFKFFLDFIIILNDIAIFPILCDIDLCRIIVNLCYNILI